VYFRFEALDPKGGRVADVVEAPTLQEAADAVRSRGLFVTSLAEAGTEPRQARPSLWDRISPAGTSRDLVAFTQQMEMLLKAGTAVVPALDAVEQQATKPAWRQVIRDLRANVEQGAPLARAIDARADVFDVLFRSVVAAGESSGRLPEAFGRLVEFTRRQTELRNRVIAALVYPAILLVLSIAVISLLLGVVLPRFAELFAVLDAELPASTKVLMAVAEIASQYWPVAVAAVLALVAGVVVLVKTPGGRRLARRVLLRLPLIGRLACRIILARLCRIWGLLVDAKVPLLDAVELAKQSTRVEEFAALMDRIKEAVSQGRTAANVLRQTHIVPATLAAAIGTGEESGRLGESLLFVASCMEEENQQLINALTRIAEPVILVFLGLVVGIVAISLYVPLFDMATAMAQ